MRGIMSGVAHLPSVLYHASAFQASKLKPGFLHTGELVEWDRTENNTWLYAGDDREMVILLGIVSAIEKQVPVKRARITPSTIRVTLESISSLTVYLYTIHPQKEDGWVPVNNSHNSMDGEWKTSSEVTYIHSEVIDAHRWLADNEVKLKLIPSKGK